MKAIKYILISLILTISLVLPVPAAETETANTRDIRDSIVYVVTGYDFQGEFFDVWVKGFGVLINKNYVLVSRNTVEIKPTSQTYTDIVKEKAERYKNNVPDNLKVDLTDYNLAMQNVYTYVLDGEKAYRAELLEVGSADAFAILHLTDRINTKETVVLSDTPMKKNDIVYAIGTEAEWDPIGSDASWSDENLLEKWDFFGVKSSVEGVRKNGDNEYVDFKGNFAKLTPGCPLVNKDHTVVGLITDGASGNGSAVDIKTIEAALDANNIEYDLVTEKDAPEDDTQPEEDTQSEDAVTTQELKDRLANLIQQANNELTGDYTQESKNAVTAALEAANEVMADESASKNRIEKVIDPLTQAIGGLQKVDHKPEYIRYGIIAAVIIVIILLLLILPKKIRNYMSKEDWEREEEKEERKTQKKKGSKGSKSKKKKNDDDDEWDDATGVLRDDDEGATGVLNDSETNAWMVQSNGKRIQLNKNKFIIGKSSDDVDYRIPNHTVSRKHCQILRRGDDFYIEDLHSTNGTYVDGTKLEPNDPQLIMDGQEILISDERFTFEQS